MHFVILGKSNACSAPACSELALALAARGVWGGPHAYFASAWRTSDCIIVLFSIASLAGTSSPLRGLKALRAARALRPLRLLSRFPQLQVRHLCVLLAQLTVAASPLLPLVRTILTSAPLPLVHRS